MNAAAFQLIIPGEAQAAPAQLALLGAWQPTSTPDSLSFGGELPGLVWRADLPADALEAAQALHGHDQIQRQTGQALAAAGPLLAQDLRQAAGSGGAGLSYGLPGDAASSRQAILAQALTFRAEEVSFALQDDWAQAVALAGRFTAQVRRLVDQFALVESSCAGRRVGRTRVEWLGGVSTWLAAGSSPASLSDHHRVLAQALATRQQWLRLVMLIAAGAAKIGLAMAAGPYNPIALWAAWTYLWKVIEQFQALQPSA